MQLNLIPAPFVIDRQNPHPMDAVLSRLCHIPNDDPVDSAGILRDGSRYCRSFERIEPADLCRGVWRWGRICVS